MALTPEESIALILDDDADVVSLRGTGNKFFVGIDLVPEETARPYQHCVVTNTDVGRHLGGRDGFTTTQFILDTFADTSATCMQLARASRLALEGYKGMVSDGDDLLDIKYLHWIDESHVSAVALSGSDKAVAYIRQQYEMFSANPSG